MKPFREAPEERPPATDYFEIQCDTAVYYVTRGEARRVVCLLQRRWPPRWIRVTELFGAELRLLRRTITAICESTDAQRAQERNFRRTRRAENRQDWRPWEDDDDW